MCDTYHKYDKLIFQDLVHHAVTTDPNPPKPTQFPFQRASGQRLFPQPIDCPHDPNAVMLRDPRKFPGGAALNPNRVAHA